MMEPFREFLINTSKQNKLLNLKRAAGGGVHVLNTSVFPV